MKDYLILLFVGISLIGCKHIDLPDSQTCDRIHTTNNFDIYITENYIKIDDSTLNDISDIRGIVADIREQSDVGRLRGSLYADKDCRYIRIDSVLQEFRKSFVLPIYFHTNLINDSCGISLKLPPLVDFIDSTNRYYQGLSAAQRDSMDYYLIEIAGTDLFLVNDKLFDSDSLKVFFKDLAFLNRKYGIVIKPTKVDKYGSIISLLDLYIIQINDLRNDLSIKRFGKPMVNIEGEDLHFIQSEYGRRIMINSPIVD